MLTPLQVCRGWRAWRAFHTGIFGLWPLCGVLALSLTLQTSFWCRESWDGLRFAEFATWGKPCLPTCLPPCWRRFFIVLWGAGFGGFEVCWWLAVGQHKDLQQFETWKPSPPGSLGASFSNRCRWSFGGRFKVFLLGLFLLNFLSYREFANSFLSLLSLQTEVQQNEQN